MKKLSLILVALATLVMVGCKPLTGCTHDWVLTDEVAPTCVADGVKTYTCTFCDKTKEDPVKKLDHSAWYEAKEVKSVSYDMQTGLTDKTTIDCYGDKCLICNKYPNKKTFAFFDSPTTIGVATGVIDDTETREWFLPIDEELIKFYNLYYDKVVKNRNKDWTYYCKCSCEDGDGCNCGITCKSDCDKKECVRSNYNTVYFGDYYIKVPNN